MPYVNVMKSLIVVFGLAIPFVASAENSFVPIDASPSLNLEEVVALYENAHDLIDYSDFETFPVELSASFKDFALLKKESCEVIHTPEGQKLPSFKAAGTYRTWQSYIPKDTFYRLCGNERDIIFVGAFNPRPGDDLCKKMSLFTTTRLSGAELQTDLTKNNSIFSDIGSPVRFSTRKNGTTKIGKMSKLDSAGNEVPLFYSLCEKQTEFFCYGNFQKKGKGNVGHSWKQWIRPIAAAKTLSEAQDAYAKEAEHSCQRYYILHDDKWRAECLTQAKRRMNCTDSAESVMNAFHYQLQD